MSRQQPSRYDYQSRFQVPLNSLDAMMLDFIRTDNCNNAFTHKEMVISALRAYWSPIAAAASREKGNPISDEALSDLAFTAVLHLQAHARMLYRKYCSEFSPKHRRRVKDKKLDPVALSPEPAVNPNLLSDEEYFHHHFENGK